MTAAVTTETLLELVTNCGPMTVAAAIRFLARDESAARAVRRSMQQLIKEKRVQVMPERSRGRSDGRVVRVTPQAGECAPRRRRYLPRLPRETPDHLIPAPALQPRWPAHITGAVLAPLITGRFIHG